MALELTVGRQPTPASNPASTFEMLHEAGTASVIPYSSRIIVTVKIQPFDWERVLHRRDGLQELVNLSVHMHKARDREILPR